jgi:subtilisin family serine protease
MIVLQTMGFWKNVRDVVDMIKKPRSQGRISPLITIISSTLIVLLFSNWILSPVSQNSFFEAKALRFDTTSLQGKNDDLRINSHNVAKKLREVTGEKIPNDYIVVLKNNNFLSSVRSLAGEAKSEGAALGQIYDNALRGFSIKVPNDNVLKAIMKNPDVDYVQPDVKVKAFAQSLPTGVNRVDGDLSSTKSGDGRGVVNVDIGIMDTGIDLNHPDLNVYRQVTFVSGTSSGNDDNGHGTAVAGIAAAKDNSQGVVGLAPGARLWAIKVLDSNGIGSSSNIIKGIDYVTQHANEIDVVNLSFGAVGQNKALHSAIIKSVAAGVTYTAAAGNEAIDASSVFPASYPEVIAVSAIVDTDGKCGGISGISTTVGKDDSFASFSNYGSVIDLAAPGVLIKTTTKGSSYTTFSGTSVSTPHVTGAVALYKSEHPGASPSDIRNALRSLGSSPSTTCDGKGHGYFTGDRDKIAEPLLYTASRSSSAPSGCTTNIAINRVSASGNQVGYPPSNVFDNSLSTRWSNPGIGSWIRADLGISKNICSVDIAWWKGNERQYKFTIATSTDGTTFVNKFSGTSSGSTLNSEKYFFPSTSARYVKITVNGNNVNNYAHITELDVFGASVSSLSFKLPLLP